MSVSCFGFAVGTPPPRRRTGAQEAERRRALALVASCNADGCTEALMLTHVFTVEQVVELVRAGLATARAERVVAGSRKFEAATA